MKLSEVREIFADHYPEGYIRSGSKVGGATASRWAVSFDGQRIYEYTGTLRGTLERILGDKLTSQQWDLLNGIIARCGNGCPITAEYLQYDHCLNCGNTVITIYS